MRKLGRRLLFCCLFSATQVEAASLVAHLPSATSESPEELARSVEQLGRVLSMEGEPPLDVHLFRRLSDARAFVAAHSRDVAFVLGEPALLLDLLADGSQLPLVGLRAAGSESHQKAVIVRASSPFVRLADTKGRSLSTTLGDGERPRAYLGQEVFDGLMEPGSWFGELIPVADEFESVASVLYGAADAGLVSVANPQLATHLGRDLRQIYLSPPLALPLLTVRRGYLAPTQENSLRARLAESSGTGETIGGLRMARWVPSVRSPSYMLDGLKPRKRSWEILAPRSEDVAEPPELPESLFLLATELPPLAPPSDVHELQQELLEDSDPPR